MRASNVKTSMLSANKIIEYRKTCGFVCIWLKYISRNHTFGRVRQAKIQISLRSRAVWSESSLGAFWIAKDAKVLQTDNEDSDQSQWRYSLLKNFTQEKTEFPADLTGSPREANRTIQTVIFFEELLGLLRWQSLRSMWKKCQVIIYSLCSDIITVCRGGETYCIACWPAPRILVFIFCGPRPAKTCLRANADSKGPDPLNRIIGQMLGWDCACVGWIWICAFCACSKTHFRLARPMSSKNSKHSREPCCWIVWSATLLFAFVVKCKCSHILYTWNMQSLYCNMYVTVLVWHVLLHMSYKNSNIHIRVTVT